MTSLNESSVTVTLGDCERSLTVTPKALLTCSAYNGGLLQIYNQVRLMHVQAMLFVLRAGLNDSKTSDEDFITQIWQGGGLSSIQPALEEYINLLQSGGLKQKAEEAPSEGKS